RSRLPSRPPARRDHNRGASRGRVRVTGLCQDRQERGVRGKRRTMSTQFDLVVIGGGLAGLSAALTGARLGRSVAILTGGAIGGQLVSIEKIEGVPGFAEGV